MGCKCLSVENVMKIFAPLADFTLIAGVDQERIPVVRKLITKNCKYFEAMLGSGFREGAQQEVTLKEIDGSTLKAIIIYIYMGNVELTEYSVTYILAGASSMEIVPLEKMCEEFLQKNVSKENCLQTFVLADKYGFHKLRPMALKLVAAHFKSIPKSDILELDGCILDHIFKCDKVCISEKDLFGLLVEWVEHDEINRAQFMPNMLKSIRLEYLPGEFILSLAEPIFTRFDSKELVRDEVYRRMLTVTPTRHQRSNGRSYIAKNIFYACITNEQTINIYKCYPDSERLPAIQFSDSGEGHGFVFHDGKFYKMGGYYSDEGGRTSDEVECIDLETRQHTKLPNMLNVRSSFKPIASGKYIYVLGGCTKNGSLGDCERFDTETKQWEALPPMSRSLVDFSGIDIQGKLVVVKKFVNSSTIASYDPKTSTWLWPSEINLRVDRIKKGDKPHIIEMVCGSAIYSYNIQELTLCFRERKDIRLPGVNVRKFAECSGSLYAFYELTHEQTDIKFGRIDVKNECKIVESVQSCIELEASGNFPPGFLFMH